jgi:hypothetical protein
LSEDIISGHKKNHRHKSIKTFIVVSLQKKFGHYNGYKMDYPKFYNIKKTQPKHIENQKDIISTQLIVYFEKTIHIKLKIVNT